MHSRLQSWLYTVGVALVLAILPQSIAQQQGQAGDESAIVTWSADLVRENEAPAATTQAAARAEFEFDFRKQVTTVKVRGQNLHDVTKITLGVEHARGALKAAAVKLALYDAKKDGALRESNSNAATEGGPPVVFSKTFSGNAFKEISDAVLNGQAVVQVHTSRSGEELIGLVEMHKSYK